MSKGQGSKTPKEKKLKRVTKKSLRTMQKTRQKHPMRTQARIVKYGTSGFRRNIWLSSAATVVMAAGQELPDNVVGVLAD